VTVKGNEGERTNTTQFVLTVGKPLQVSISATPTSGNIPLTVTFASSVTGGFAPYNYAWTFGDGGSSVEANPTHAYRSPGTDTVTVVVRDATGSNIEGTTEYTATVLPLQLSASAYPVSGVEPLTVAFTTTVSGGLEPYAYSWTFGDAGTSSTPSPVHAYQRAGTYSASLTFSDSLGNRKIVTITVAVIAVMFTTASVEETNGTAPLVVRFHAEPSGGLGPYSFHWAFGDGQQSGDQNPSHTYTAAGTYTVTLEVKDRSGQTNRETIGIVVKQQASPFASPAAIIAEIGAAATAVGGTLLVIRRRRKVPPPPPPP
jgi:PKD repeat protein